MTDRHHPSAAESAVTSCVGPNFDVVAGENINIFSGSSRTLVLL